MKKPNTKRIAIFEYDWSIYHYIKDFILKLAAAGYRIDFYFKDNDLGPGLANIDDFKAYQNIRFFDFTIRRARIQTVKQKCVKLLNKIAINCKMPRNDSADRIIDSHVLQKSRDTMREHSYDCMIGVEKKGLIWAGIMAETHDCPLVYFNLELFIEDNPSLFRIYHLRNAEKKYHRRAAATIIQDRHRAAALFKANGIDHAKAIYFPVSANGDIMRNKSRLLHDKLKISDDKKIILCFGAIGKNRYISEIVTMAANLDADTILVIHGVGSPQYIKSLQSIAPKDKVIFSLEFLPEDRIQELVSSADIGLALYKTTNANDRLIAFSSSKIAYYTQCGIPMIAFDTESFKELISRHKCAELIHRIDEIPDKAKQILDNYAAYRENAYAAYQEFYNVDVNCSRLLNNLETIINGAPDIT